MDGKASGWGRQVWLSRIGEIVYEGEFRDGKEHGRGTKTYSNGSRYEGDWRNGKKHGYGTETWASGSRYEGEFRDGKEHGRGTINYANGNRYEGEWRDGKRHGQGSHDYTDGSRYEGEWRDGKRHGQGSHDYTDGNRYEGEWRDDKRHGRGTINYANGNRYEGEWRDNRRYGHGTYTWAYGDRYEGNYRDDKPNGWGVGTFANGGVYEGHWANGCLETSKGNWAVMHSTAEKCGFIVPTESIEWPFKRSTIASLTEADVEIMYQALQDSLETEPSGTTRTWQNSDSGNAGSITPTQTYQRDDQTYCREFTQTLTIGSRTEEAYGTACREPDGTWDIVS